MGHSGFTCIRFTLCTCNVLAWLAGCGILGVGIWLNLAYGGYATILPAYSSLSADSLCIIAGVVTFAISFFGCCGSWFRNRCLLLMYFTLVTLTFSLEVTVGTLAFVYRESLTDTLRKQFTVGIQKNYQQPGEQGFTVTWDHIQTELKCCGVVESSDWYKIDAWPKEDRVPDSCCHNSTYEHDCGKNLKNIYEKGCFEKIRVWVIEQLHVVGIIVLVFAFIQLFGLVASMLIYCTLRRQSRKMDY